MMGKLVSKTYLNGWEIKLFDTYKTNVIGKGGAAVIFFAPNGTGQLNYSTLEQAYEKYQELTKRALEKKQSYND